MAIQVADNFSYQGAKPLDARLKYNNVADMVAVGASTIYDGILAYVVATKTYYTYDSTNDVDESLGKWRELETGGSIIEGYYYNGSFYEDVSHTIGITGEAETLYISLDTGKLYRYNGTIFVIVGADIDTVVYVPAGSITFANLPVLSADVLGYIYNIEDAFTTTADFVEGAGAEYPAGSNVGIINIGTKASPTYKYDVFSGILDFSKYLEKVTTAPASPSSGDVILYTGTVSGSFTESPGVYKYDGTNWVLQDLGIKGQIIQVDTLPTASLDLAGKIYQYIGTTTSSLTQGFFYTCIEDSSNPGTYIWVQKNVQPDEDTKIQVVTMPAVTSADEGKIVQFIGDTAGGYTNGYFYKCVEDPDNVGAYIWIQKNIQPDNDTQIQVETMPTAVAILEDRIVQYVGATDSTYTNGYFYKCIEDTENPGAYEWEAVSVQEGGSGSGTLGKDITASVAVGGIKVGDAYTIGTNYDDMWQDLLDPIKYPTLTNPSASISGGTTLLETGASVSRTISASFSRGSINPAYGTSGYRSGAAVDYALNGGAAQAVNSFTQTVSESNKTFKIKVNYGAGEQPKDSKGNDYNSPLPAGYVETSTLTYSFVDAMWANTTSIDTIAKLSLVAKSSGQRDFVFPAQTVANPETFDIPASWTVTAVEVKNDMSGAYEEASAQFTVTDTTHDNAAGTSVAYKRYTFNLGYPTGSRTVRVKFS